MFRKFLTIAALAFLPGTAFAQPAGGRAAPAPLQVPNPHYVTVPMSIDVNAPVDKVWARIGKYCDVGEWLGNSDVNNCKITSGVDGEIGALRTVANEVLVGRTRSLIPTRRRRARG